MSFKELVERCVSDPFIKKNVRNFKKSSLFFFYIQRTESHTLSARDYVESGTRVSKGVSYKDGFRG
jgi:hypothetical protein